MASLNVRSGKFKVQSWSKSQRQSFTELWTNLKSMSLPFAITELSVTSSSTKHIVPGEVTKLGPNSGLSLLKITERSASEFDVLKYSCYNTIFKLQKVVSLSYLPQIDCSFVANVSSAILSAFPYLTSI